MKTANIYKLSQIQAGLKDKHFHWHETITGFADTFKICALRPADTKGFFRLIGKNVEHIVSGSILVKLFRTGRCHSHDEIYLITDAKHPL